MRRWGLREIGLRKRGESHGEHPTRTRFGTRVDGVSSQVTSSVARGRLERRALRRNAAFEFCLICFNSAPLYLSLQSAL